MENTLLKIFNINYGSAFLLIILSYATIEWIKMIKDKSYRIQHKTYNTLSEIDIKIAKYLVENMTGREFEKFCTWLFKKSGMYKSVELTAAECDGGKDIILNEDTYVECKRWSEGNGTFSSLEIGREICQKLVGAMVGDGIKKGIIITTGIIHKNAWDYLKNIEKNSDLQITFMTFAELLGMIREINSDEVLEKIINIKDETILVTE